jgi:demethylmenaquinone methyltransferase/2-methoxy-6-polyprenyl-1,4-benzoquinol methylase
MSASTTSRTQTDVVHTPHAVLDHYYASEERRRGFVGSLFDATAMDYDRLERVLGWGTGSWYRREALLRAGLQPGMKVLDVAIGTGLVARAAQEVLGPQGQLIGIDPSSGMMQAFGGDAAPPLVRGRAEALPFADGSFDFLSLGFALRHVSDLEQTFREFRRVLKPGGRVLLLEITRPAGCWANRFLRLYLRTLVPVIARVIARNARTPDLYRYYWDTIEACAPPEKVLGTLQATGFAEAQRHVEIGVFSEYCARA